MAPTMLNLFFVQELLKPVNPLAWEHFLQRLRMAGRRKIPAVKENERRYAAGHRRKNPEKHRADVRQWCEENADAVKNNGRQWQKENRAYRNSYCRQRRAEQIAIRILETLRSRIYIAIRGVTKSARTRELLGMEIPEFKVYLQGQFHPGMCWENYGPGWHIDHIRPCASFNLTDPAQQRECFNWSNCQPLFAEDNLRKGAYF